MVNCLACDRTGKLTVHDRVPVRALPPGLLAGYAADSPSLVADTLLDPRLARRNRFALDWDGCWELDAPPMAVDSPWPLRITVAFADPVPVRPERLLAQGLGIGRREIAARVKADIPLNRRTRRDFAFVLMGSAG
ncbi:DUF1062 domain-containing protein [Streptomyces sp. NPDC049881]|uniref:DUF1062 domain-containing protein n=1 Tax=Streptomyces sp. NPDC049881 TaxID=3155778 RepID=UPI00343E1426